MAKIKYVSFFNREEQTTLLRSFCGLLVRVYILGNLKPDGKFYSSGEKTYLF